VPCAFDSFCKQALVSRADPADSPGQYLPPFRNEVTEELSVLEINIGYFLGAEFADSLAPDTETSWTWHIVRLSQFPVPSSQFPVPGSTLFFTGN
jgi:hypothetical protein